MLKNYFILIVQPLRDIHFDERIGNFNQRAFSRELITALTLIGIFLLIIACVNFINLATVQAINRSKEVGVRKVLGASVRSIVYLFPKEFTLLIGLAFLIAAPVAYYSMYQWLANFTFRIELDWRLFLLAIVISVAIAWITVGYKAIKAALANPVNRLWTE